jgi:hypothetical protein
VGVGAGFSCGVCSACRGKWWVWLLRDRCWRWLRRVGAGYGCVGVGVCRGTVYSR